MDGLRLPSGNIAKPRERLLAFCRGEYAYYDAIPSLDANRIDPLDVLVTVAMNSRVDSAVKVHRVHQGLAENCNPRLPALPEDADLIDLDRWREPLRELLHAAVQAHFVLIPVATKVLHRKRRFLIPMLDGVVLRYYLDTPELRALLPGTENKAKAADVAMEALTLFHADLVHTRDAIGALRVWLEEQGFSLSPVRVLELLVWMEVEPAGYYR
jgi:hypothetical protein